VLAPVAWRTPPRHYGPWESVASLLTEGLVARGIDVTLFATLDSITSAALDGVCPHGYAEDPGMDGRVWEALHVAHALARSAEFDLVHSHLDWLPLVFGDFARAPMVTTIHGFSGPGILPAYARSRSAFVSISDADRCAELDYVATVHHGIDLDALPFHGSPGQDLVAFGRVHPDKGTADAIAIARLAGRRLIICGIVQDERYFAEQIEPHIDGDSVVFRGSVGPKERAETLGSAAVLLHPVHFADPHGSMGEVVDVGVTGYLAPDVESAAAAVESAARLDRAAVRARAAARFAVDRMVDDYLRVYEAILARPLSGSDQLSLGARTMACTEALSFAGYRAGFIPGE
jgi:glycosyltransferase involved in cell wall biosynthesis